ncbi:MAG: K+/H+ antiporter subunit F [Gemmatimonadaceae bacterium]|jgi:multicomponent K+:H+ antiporter subunit F|nr:K+/H+ antiporter subunit F [Gemmatimonadaceae bacterium]
MNTPTPITGAIVIALALLLTAIVLNVWRLLRGPTAPDRIVALDTAQINAIALLVLLGIARDSALWFEAALLLALLGFIGTVALCKAVLRGSVVE